MIKLRCPRRGGVENEAASSSYKLFEEDASAHLQRLDLGAPVTKLLH